MSSSFDLPDVDRFVAGAIGEPGRRVFYFQFAAGGTVISLKCEKLQVAALVDHLQKMLVDLPAVGAPPLTGVGLVTPVLDEWVVGAIGLGYDENTDRIVVVFEEADGNDDDDEDERDGQARVSITREQASVFTEQATQLVTAGRPTCVRCGAPINPGGFTCVCWN